MARFARDRSLVEALVDGVEALLRAEGSYDSDDLLNWLKANRETQLHDLYDQYRDHSDPALTANQQIERFLSRLGQIKIGAPVSERLIDAREGRDCNGACPSSVWEVSEQSKAGLAAARVRLFGPEGFFDQIAAEPPLNVSPGWLDHSIGMFKDDPVFAEIVRLGREYREADRPADDEP